MKNAAAPPPLAGACTHADAARIGYSVEENVGRLLRYHWTLKRLADVEVARLPGTPEWEVKGAFALHQWLDVEHADALRTRIGEMRSPVPRMDRPPDTSLEAVLRTVEAAPDTVELLAGIHDVLRPRLVAAWRDHLARTNPLVDHPTRRILRSALGEQEEMLTWGEAALEALTSDEEARSRRTGFARRVAAELAAAGGVAGDAPRENADSGAISDPGPAGAGRGNEPHPSHDFTPRRDARFHGAHDFDFPPHLVYALPHVPADERNLALLCKRLLEMDVPEMMASFLAERTDAPWELRRDYARQLWDEARHSMMGEVAFESMGVDWRAVPLNVGFSLRLNLHADPFERQVVLWAIEQSLMPATTGKRFEYETAREAGDELSAHFHDYDWADEVLHARIGRRWVTAAGLEPEEAMERAREIHERTWAALEDYRVREATGEWWADFVRSVLGRETAADPGELVADPTVVPGSE